tara:strand:- start:131 stop:244 length:114 start_codon:yes stop_codon:yes gene_type:complete
MFMKLVEILRIIILTAICCGVGALLVMNVLDSANSVV